MAVLLKIVVYKLNVFTHSLYPVGTVVVTGVTLTRMKVGCLGLQKNMLSKPVWCLLQVSGKQGLTAHEGRLIMIS